MQGLGRAVYHTTGNIYEGQFQKGKPHGYGRLIYGKPALETFQGQFSAGTPIGEQLTPGKVKKSDDMEVEGKPEAKKAEVEKIEKVKEGKITKVENKPETIPIEVPEVIDITSPEKQ